MPAKRVKAKSRLKGKFGAKTQRDKEQEQIELGYKTAVSLLAEISLPDEVKPTKDSLTSLAKINEYPEFIRVTRGKKTYNPAKEAILKEIGSNIYTALTFCYIILETDTSKSFDIDHVCPRDYFVQKQKLLLNYLNENREFAKGFLGEQEIGLIDSIALNDHRKKIAIYFSRDKDSGEIRATKWLCDAFYNSTSNLSYLLHYINREKRAMKPSLWLERQEINEEFKKYLLSYGGVSEGIVMQGVITGAKDKMERVVLRGVERGENINIYLHQGAYEGLGNFIREWFLINKSKTIQASKEISDIKNQLYELLKDEFHGKIPVKGVKLEKLLILINGIFSANKMFLSAIGSSGSDSSATKEGHKTNWQITALKALRYMSTLKRIKKLISAQIAADYQETFNNEFYNIFFAKGFLDLPPVALDEAYHEVTQAFDGESKENLKPVTKDDFLKFVDELIDKVDPVKQNLRERALREAAEHKAEEERAQKEAAEHKAEEERAQKEAALRDNARLRALLVSQGQQVPLETDVKVQSATGKSATSRPLTRLFDTQSMDERLGPVRRSRSSISEQAIETKSAVERPAKIRRR